ncbi:MAG TPA: TetR/AcrR family transcriptional regulator [Anaerolineales bacterium]|jgi:AcrR family transcriptional regulator|nr:TetR/AcrR family transcriptional regulator [Anaerolineales bacterium]
MTKPKSPKREYDSTRRQAQANETRRRILEAARNQFMERGYSGATAEAIAAEAGVAAQTIYAIFKNKKKLLVSLMNVSPTTGVEDHTPMPERPSVQAVSHEHDQRRQLQMFAQVVASNLEQVAVISEIMKDAARIEPDFDRILQKLNRQRLEHMTLAVQQIAANGSFREDMDVEYARNTVWTLTSPEVFLLLTRDRGWSKEKYAQWLADTLTRALLP